MRFDTRDKRKKARKIIINNLCNVFGYDRIRATYYTGLWVESGSKFLPDDVREDIRISKIQFEYSLKTG